MKNIFYFLCATAAVSAFSSCARNELLSGTYSEKVRLEFAAKQDIMTPATRTELAEANTVEWVAGDAISLFDPEGANNEFSTADSGPSAVFTGTAADIPGTYYALYPYDAAATVSSGLITTELVSLQDAAAGTFADGLNPSVAQCDENRSLSFKNICAAVKFTLGGNGVVRAVFSGNNGEFLAGKIQADASGPAPSASVIADGKAELELDGNLVAGGTYYFIAAPADLSKGITVRLYDAEGNIWEKTGSNPAVLSAGKILNLGTLTPDAYFPEEGYELVNGVYHVYNAEGLQNWAQAGYNDAVLERDIDMSGIVWTPVGSGIETGYTGEFDGSGKTVYNLAVDCDAEQAGFFGTLGAGAKVHDVTFSGASVKSSASNSSAGVVAGFNIGNINNCKVLSSEVSGWYAGAIAGHNSVQVTSCTASGVTVKSVYSGGYAGGIVGINYGKIEDCHLASGEAAGYVNHISADVSSGAAGGITGHNAQGSGIETSGRVWYCSVYGTEVSAQNAGGVIGDNDFGTIAQCYAENSSVTRSNISGSHFRLGGIVGYNTRGDVVACHSSYMTIGSEELASEAVGGIVGLNNNSSANIYGCFSSHAGLYGTVGGEQPGKGAIAGYTNGNVTSCYALLPDGASDIKLIGGGGTMDHCVEVGETNYDYLIDAVGDLNANDGTVWKAASIWNIVAGNAPSIHADYDGETVQ